MIEGFEPAERFALRLDAADPLAPYRERFHLPARPDGTPVIYFCGHSLGLQPRAGRALVEQDLDDWAALGVGGHFEAATPWYSYHDVFRESGARLVGALPGEVVMMNSLTVNLHLMMATFYRPTRKRHAILIEDSAFSSDAYAVASQIRHHGFDPVDSLLVARPQPGEAGVSIEALEGILQDRGQEIALVLLPGVQYFTGQVFDIERITAAAHRHGCVAGFDLAHAAGNIVLRLHDWDVDFAVWCSYKYLNGGPGAAGGCFVHQRHGENPALPRLAGWWGDNPETRFEMDREREFAPQPGAAGWQISNPPILSMAPLRAALEIFDEAGMEALRHKSERLTIYLQDLIDTLPDGRPELITPRDPGQRGCQLSLRLRGDARVALATLASEGVVCDFRPPDAIRVAPVPLYNTFHEVWRFARILGGAGPAGAARNRG